MTAAATATSQQLWTSGGALVQRAQEPNIPFGESLTSITYDMVANTELDESAPYKVVHVM